ncbi:hypothetical protein COOONC_10277 [Cooperia oncophora]
MHIEISHYWLNDYASNIGFGIFHSGIEVYGVEYAYGGHPYAFSGVFENSPQDAEELGENFKFRQCIVIGETAFSASAVRELIKSLGQEYRGDRYHLISRNCNHFSAVLAKALTGNDIPTWINRLANLSGSIPFLERCLPQEWLTPVALQQSLDDQRSSDRTRSAVNDSHKRLSIDSAEDALDVKLNGMQCIVIGETAFSASAVRELIKSLGQEYRGDRYHLISRNCNHFSAVLAKALTGNDIPTWINRLANLSGSIPFLERCLPQEWLTPVALQQSLDDQRSSDRTRSAVNDSHKRLSIDSAEDALDVKLNGIFSSHSGIRPWDLRAVITPHHFHLVPTVATGRLHQYNGYGHKSSQQWLETFGPEEAMFWAHLLKLRIQCQTPQR